jgi:hypothetical protein
MDSLSLAIDFLKWCVKGIAFKIGFQLGEFEQILGAVLLLALGIFCAGFFLRGMLNAS